LFEKSSIVQAVNSVYKTLQNQLIRTYNINDVEKSYKIANELLEIHGMDKDRFSIISQIEELLIGNLNDNSIDDNSNKNEKTIKGVLKEATLPIDKIVGYRFLYRKLIEIYGKKEAKRLTGLMYDYTLALADSSSIILPYCWSFNTSELILTGKPFGQLQSKPVKRVDSYISLLNEVIHQAANHLAGAIAVAGLFLDIAHLLLIKEKKSLEDLKKEEYRNYLKNQFQKFIHGVNSLSRSAAMESPFLNISLFDRIKLKKLLEEYMWYFSFTNEKEDVITFKEEYIIEFIIELQNIFMEFFDKGDPSNEGMPYRFPICSINISKTKNVINNEWIIEDKEFLESICNKDIFRYNIFISEGFKIASCCRLQSDSEMLELASQVNSFGAGGSVSIGSHRVLTINFMRLALQSSSKEEFFFLLKNRIKDCKNILFTHKQLLKDFEGSQFFLRTKRINLDRMFSTIGILGYVEAEETLKRKNIFPKEYDVMKDMMYFLNEEVNSNNEEFTGCIFNIEQIPGESMVHRLARADKILFPEENIPYDIYSNQFIPLWDTESTIWERIEKDGIYNQLLTGGGIVHANVGEHITGKQAEKIIDYAVKCGCEHFALTGTFCKCEDGHVLLGNRDTCAKCGKPIISKIARTVGFFTPVEDWSSYKQVYDFSKRIEYTNKDI